MLSSDLLKWDGRGDNVLLIAGVSPVHGSGGLFMFDGSSLQRIDRLPAAGLAVTDRHVVRVLCSEAVYDGSGDVFLYDQNGVQHYFRIDGLTDAHDVHWDGEAIVCVSSTRNAIMWLNLSGEVRRTWAPSEVEDCWHINSYVQHNGTGYCSAFGQFQESREWVDHKDDQSGVIYDLAEGRAEVTGLDCPHNPIMLPEGWVVCNSGTGELMRIDPASKQILQRLKLNGWLRGLTVSDDYYFVGESADRRKLNFASSASLCIINRKTWTEFARFTVPVGEITAILVVSKSFVGGLLRGFRTNPFRDDDFDQYNLFYRTGRDPVFAPCMCEPLPPGACKIRIQVDSPPETVEVNSMFSLDVQLENLGTGILASKPPNPVYISSRWFSRDNSDKVEGPRNGLNRTVLPGYSFNRKVKFRAPGKAGKYELRITLVQEWVAWFDDVDPANGVSLEVTVNMPEAEKGVGATV